MKSGRDMARTPAFPSTITSRTSAAVRATIAPREPGNLSAMSQTHSAPDLLLPKPRPASNIHFAHRPSGGSWLSRAVTTCQSVARTF